MKEFIKFVEIMSEPNIKKNFKKFFSELYSSLFLAMKFAGIVVSCGLNIALKWNLCIIAKDDSESGLYNYES